VTSYPTTRLESYMLSSGPLRHQNRRFEEGRSKRRRDAYASPV